MPDYRVPDQRIDEMVMREAGLAAFGLRAAAGAWSVSPGAMTDGWFPQWFIDSWPGGRAAAKKLVTANVWSKQRRGTQDGYQEDPEIWDREQTPAAKLLEQREKARVRAERSRQGKKDKAAQEYAETQPHLPGSLVGVPGGRDRPPPDPSVTRDVTGHVTRDTTGDVTQQRHGARALAPMPRPVPEGGNLEEEGSRSEHAAARGEDPDPASCPQPRDLLGPQKRHALERTFDEFSADELAELDPRCDLHRALPPGEPVPSCTDCGVRRRAIRAAQGRARARDRGYQAEDDSARAARRALREACGECDEHGWVVADDGTPVEPARRCRHERLERELHAADPPSEDRDDVVDDGRYAVHTPRWDEQRWAT